MWISECDVMNLDLILFLLIINRNSNNTILYNTSGILINEEGRFCKLNGVVNIFFYLESFCMSIRIIEFTLCA